MVVWVFDVADGSLVRIRRERDRLATGVRLRRNIVLVRRVARCARYDQAAGAVPCFRRRRIAFRVIRALRDHPQWRRRFLQQVLLPLRVRAAPVQRILVIAAATRLAVCQHVVERVVCRVALHRREVRYTRHVPRIVVAIALSELLLMQEQPRQLREVHLLQVHDPHLQRRIPPRHHHRRRSERPPRPFLAPLHLR